MKAIALSPEMISKLQIMLVAMTREYEAEASSKLKFKESRRRMFSASWALIEELSEAIRPDTPAVQTEIGYLVERSKHDFVNETCINAQVLVLLGRMDVSEVATRWDFEALPDANEAATVAAKWLWGIFTDGNLPVSPSEWWTALDKE